MVYLEELYGSQGPAVMSQGPGRIVIAMGPVRKSGRANEAWGLVRGLRRARGDDNLVQSVVYDF